MNEQLLKAVDERIDDLVALTVDLIRFPTVNPPGEAYTPCAEYLGARLKKRGFGVDYRARRRRARRHRPLSRAPM